MTLRIAPPISQCRPVFLCCDLQERFAGLLPNFKAATFVANRMLRFGVLHGDRCLFIATEQYPKGLGHTVADIPLSSPPRGANVKVFEKTQFSMLTKEVSSAIMNHSLSQSPHDPVTVVLFGIEAHACVLQTANDVAMLPRSTVFVLADGTFSTRDEDRKYALKNMQQMPNVVVTTSESLLFQFTRTKDDPTFKSMSNICREVPPHRATSK